MLFLSNDKGSIRKVYSPEQIGSNPVCNWKEIAENPHVGADARYIFSTWGMPPATEEEIARYLPKLEAVFYGAGSVQYFARPFLRRGVRIFSAWVMNGIPVAEFTLAQILLAGKGYFQMTRKYPADGWKSAASYGECFDGNYGAKIGILGAGVIGRRVIELLRPFDIEVLVYDPYLSDESAEKLGVRKAGLDEIFSECQTISNHIANNEQTRGMLNYSLFSRMKSNATFINTGRAAQVSEDDLIRALEEFPDRTALLDVTDPTEPLPAGHKLLKMPNVFVTPHRAGSNTGELARMGSAMIEQYCNLTSGKPVNYEVTMEMLETMA